MKTARCSVCNSDIIVEDDSYEGDILDCANCGTQLEIRSLNPVQLSVLEEGEEEINSDLEKN